MPGRARCSTWRYVGPVGGLSTGGSMPASTIFPDESLQPVAVTSANAAPARVRLRMVISFPYSATEIVDQVSNTAPPPSWAIGTFSTMAVTLRFLVKSGAQLGGLNRLTASSSGPSLPSAPSSRSPRQLAAGTALALPTPPGPPKNRSARNARTWKNRITSNANESARGPMKYLTFMPPTAPVLVVIWPAFDGPIAVVAPWWVPSDAPSRNTVSVTCCTPLASGGPASNRNTKSSLAVGVAVLLATLL